MHYDKVPLVAIQLLSTAKRPSILECWCSRVQQAFKGTRILLPNSKLCNIQQQNNATSRAAVNVTCCQKYTVLKSAAEGAVASLHWAPSLNRQTEMVATAVGELVEVWLLDGTNKEELGQKLVRETLALLLPLVVPPQLTHYIIAPDPPPRLPAYLCNPLCGNWSGTSWAHCWQCQLVRMPFQRLKLTAVVLCLGNPAHVH